VDGRYVGPLSDDDAPEIVSALKEGRQVLPGRSLEDKGYKLPWSDQPRRPMQETLDPDVSPAGGTVKDPHEEDLDR
jgi:hypothetical protein